MKVWPAAAVWKYLSRLCNSLPAAVGFDRPGILACVGAGGKTSLLQSLAASRQLWPVIVTTTTKMYAHQLAQYRQVMAASYDRGAAEVRRLLNRRQPVAWFGGRQAAKVSGIPPAWVERLAAELPEAYILVEADGARGCWLKAPAAQEPVIPAGAARTVGIINAAILTQLLTPDNTHRPELVSRIIDKQPGESIGWPELVRLAVHPQGLFQYAAGCKVLLLTGCGNSRASLAARQIAGQTELAAAGIERVVTTSGFGRSMRPQAVYVL